MKTIIFFFFLFIINTASSQDNSINVFYDAGGREVIDLVNNRLQPGSYQTSFEGTNYAGGVYYYKMETNDFVVTKKMVLIK
ncbi:MAG: T9SS type A sorting domain-containing protein [Bacteroidota bacterium]|nr:T9SS type A sorting domain-containing protein [Bacteroidota bacterium]